MRQRHEPKPEPTKEEMTATYFRALSNRGKALQRMGYAAVGQVFLDAATDIAVIAVTQFGMTLDEIGYKV